jgi:hypothetical protein
MQTSERGKKKKNDDIKQQNQHAEEKPVTLKHQMSIS